MKRLQNLSYKTLFAILFFSLAGIVFFLKIGGKTQKVSAAWWDEMWHYRKAISITNSSGSNLTDFQVAISVGTSQLIADGKMQTDCDDIRITDINGNLLPYWIEENNPGCNKLTDTKIWLKASSLPTSGSVIYLYYGNSSAGTVSNVTTTFGPLQKLSLGASYTVAPSPQASYPDNSGRQLTNGLIREDLYQTTEATVGWNYQNPVITINLNKIAVISSFKFYLGGGGAGGINIPSQITTSYSLDNSNYTSIGVGNSWTNIEQWVTINNNSLVAAKYGQSTITSNQWAMVGEIEIYGYPGSSITASTSSTIQSEELGTGPIAYWKFNEGIGTTAYDSAGNFNGKLIGSTIPTWQNEDQCIEGKCLRFNGGAIDITGNNVLNTDSFTYSTWVKINAYNPDSNISSTIITNYGSLKGTFLYIYNNGKLSVRTHNGVITSLDYRSNEIIQLNQWYHIALTYDGNNLSLYSNGKKIWNGTTTIVNSTTNHYYIGGWSTNYLLNGYIDEPKIYPYARTADQIKLDYNSRGSMSGPGVNMGVQSNTAPSLKSSLIAHYKFDEGSGTTVYNSGIGGTAINGTFGTGDSAPSWTNEGKNGKALNFNDVDYVYVPSNSVINTTDSVTVSAWIKTINSSASQTIVSRNGPLFLRLNGGKFRVGIYTGSWFFGDGNISINSNQWYHVVLVYDGSFVKSYVNGVLDIKSAKTGSLSAFSNLYFGRPVPGGEQFPFYGTIDEVKIYNRALTADEIKQDYNAGSAIQFGQTTQNIGGTTISLEYCIPGDTSYCAPPIAEWKMDEGVGTSVVDTSGNNNTGTLINSPTWVQGKIGKGLNLNGSNNNIDLGTWFNYQTFSLNLWVKPGETQLQYADIADNNHTGTRSWNLQQNSTTTNQYSFTTMNPSGNCNSGTFNLTANTWQYLSLVRDSTSINVYINGLLVKSSTTNCSLSINYDGTQYFRLGRWGGGGRNWNGIQDQVRLYNYARTPAQIAYDYNKGGPVGWWKFDECQGNIAYDWSGIGNTGVINIGASGSQNSLGTCQVGTSAAWTNGATGKVNSSLNFDGVDDYVSINDSDSLDITKAITISTWIKLSSSAGGYRRIVSKNRSTSYCFGVQSGNQALFTAKIGGVEQVPNVANTVIPLNVWNHLLVTYDGSIIKYYLNGQPDGTTTPSPTGDISINTNPLTIGSEGTSTLFPGQIDDVRIYNYALTSEQVKTVFNNGAINFN